MGLIRPFDPVKLVIPALLSDATTVSSVRRSLESAFGAIDYQSPALAFSYTDYYEKEMGRGLVRLFFSIDELFAADGLADAKLRTDLIEREHAGSLGRRVNLDPGILSEGRFILATTKDHAHRIPLRSGIYGEVTLLFHRGGFETLPWTYPDYGTPEYRNILLAIRKIYREQLKGRSGS